MAHIIMVEGENYIGHGMHFQLGTIAEVTDPDLLKTLLSKTTASGNTRFEVYDPSTVQVPEKKVVNQTGPKTAEDYITLLQDMGVPYPENATVRTLAALYKRAATKNGTLNSGDLKVSDLRKTADTAEAVNASADVSTEVGEEVITEAKASGNVNISKKTTTIK